MDDFWLIDFTIIPVDNYLRSPGLKFKCVACKEGWESKVYREGECLYSAIQELYRDHGIKHK
jgi:hypothetical protein